MTERFFEKLFCKKKKNLDQNEDDEVYEPHQQQSEEEKNKQAEADQASEQIEKQDFQEAPSAQQKIEIENDETKHNQIIEVQTQPQNPPIKQPAEQVQINQKIKVIAINKLPDDQVNINIQNQNNFIQNQFNPQQQYQQNQAIFQNQQQMQQFQNQQQQYVNCQNGTLNQIENANYQNSHNQQIFQKNQNYHDNQGFKNQNFQFNGGCEAYGNQQNQIIQQANQQNQFIQYDNQQNFNQQGNQQNSINYNQQNQFYQYDDQQNTFNQQNDYKNSNQINQINNYPNGQNQFNFQNGNQQIYFNNEIYYDNFQNQQRQDFNASQSVFQPKKPGSNQIFQSQQSNFKKSGRNFVNNAQKNEQIPLQNFNSSGQKSSPKYDEFSETKTKQIICQHCQNEILRAYIQLTCHHCYCQECLKEFLKVQVNQQKTTFFHCLCGKKIKPQQVWDNNRKSDLRIYGKKKDDVVEQLKSQLLINQVKEIEDQLKVLENYTKCDQCKIFFVLNNNHYPQEFFCHACEKKTNIN